MLFFMLLGQALLACLAEAGVLDRPPHPDQIPGQYIVTFKNDTTRLEMKDHMKWVDKIHNSSTTNPLKYEGFGEIYFDLFDEAVYLGRFDPVTIKKIEEHPTILRVDADIFVRPPELNHQDETPEAIKATKDDDKPEYIIITNDGEKYDRQKKLGRIDWGPL